MRKRNGEGTISGPRKDGRYVGAFYAPTNTGTTKRVYVHGRTYDEVREKLIAEQAKVMAGIPVPAPPPAVPPSGAGPPAAAPGHMNAPAWTTLGRGRPRPASRPAATGQLTQSVALRPRAAAQVSA